MDKKSLITKEQALELLNLPLEAGESPSGRLAILHSLMNIEEEEDESEG